MSGRGAGAGSGAAGRSHGAGTSATLAAVVLFATGAAGYLVVRLTMPIVHDRYLPWIAGRTLGMGAYAALCLLVLVGLWLRHPWRARWARFHPETLLRLHAALGGSVVLLVAGHVVSLALDRYAGVGWTGALVPGAAVYRPLPVALGVGAAYGLLLVAATAGVAGRLVRRGWRPVHFLALPIFAAVWCHGLFAGSDGVRLRAVYATTGALVVAAALTRVVAVGASRPVGPPTAAGARVPEPGVRS